IQSNIVGYKSTVNYNSIRLETLRCEIQNLIMQFLYVIFYYGKQQGHLIYLIHQFFENIQFTEFLLNLSLNPLYSLLVLLYLNFLSYPLLQLIFLFNLKWIPELRDRSLWELIINSYYRKKYHFDYSMMETFSSCLPSSDDNSENTVVLNFLKDFSNFLENDALCKTECFQSNNDNNNMYLNSQYYKLQQPHQHII
ncbi:uncharacterized protein DC041_0013104, partial [Schistosoma bovis]